MNIKSINIKNFTVFDDFELDLSSGINKELSAKVKKNFGDIKNNSIIEADSKLLDDVYVS